MLPGTVLRLREPLPPLGAEDAASAGLAEGDENVWNLVKVFDVRDFGPDAGGVVPIIAPVTFSNWSSPVEIPAETLLTELGYEVIFEPDSDAGDWATPDAELVQPARSTIPAYGTPGWASAIRKRDEEAKGDAQADEVSARGAAAKAKADERKAALRAPKEDKS